MLIVDKMQPNIGYQLRTRRTDSVPSVVIKQTPSFVTPHSPLGGFLQRLSKSI
ncbi:MULTISPECIES: hypothetical protein [Nostoc]|uniref:Uncharacterized protein n=1 Tax=Nostoc paludosum FACHB-159 TaxID=2692908 RepID=A0ABR8KDX9_9NOSO|nr:MULTISPECIES: hypothetical protein [Nostoc]MBD2680206.1 hypothetical protein [Nostoc sp. FACHB-857]MBD2736388.1 hypothetical protein [Nostoc paludosum FACHB-159]